MDQNLHVPQEGSLDDALGLCVEANVPDDGGFGLVVEL